MSIHIGAKAGEIAKTVLLPGDPYRAKFVAEQLLKNARCYNTIRGMLGYTGEYKGKTISIQGTGMGIPSISIYAHELITEYEVKNLIRVGSCGCIQPDLQLKDVILAMSASTDSNVNKMRFQGKDYAATSSFKLLKNAFDVAKKLNIDVHVGNIFSTDLFYHDDPTYWKVWADYGILAIEMESAALYTLAAKFKVNALSLLTVSDQLITGEASSSEAREKSFTQMIEIALEIAE